MYIAWAKRSARRSSSALLCSSACMADNTNTPVLCLGCGESTRGPWDRRNLKSSVSQHVVPLWKSIIRRELEKRNQQADLDCVIAGPGDPDRVGQMCRKCFYAYEKVLKAQAVIESNAVKAIDAVVFASSASEKDSSQMLGKRTSSSISAISQSPSKRRTQPPVFVRSTSASRRSPHVAVSRQCHNTNYSACL